MCGGRGGHGPGGLTERHRGRRWSPADPWLTRWGVRWGKGQRWAPSQPIKTAIPDVPDTKAFPAFESRLLGGEPAQGEARMTPGLNRI